jgi:hypothetical protein
VEAAHAEVSLEDPVCLAIVLVYVDRSAHPQGSVQQGSEHGPEVPERVLRQKAHSQKSVEGQNRLLPRVLHAHEKRKGGKRATHSEVPLQKVLYCQKVGKRSGYREEESRRRQESRIGGRSSQEVRLWRPAQEEENRCEAQASPWRHSESA